MGSSSNVYNNHAVAVEKVTIRPTLDEILNIYDPCISSFVVFLFL